MANQLQIIDAGLKKYAEALQLQEELFNKSIAGKLAGQPVTNYLILCEHEPVFTLGKSGKSENILVDKNEMNAEFYQTNRGGDVTFHGPGQLVAYPILDLEKLGIGLAKYIFNLEEVIIDSLKNYNLKGERVEGANGIWLRGTTGNRKICAIGVKASRSITMHGLAMNVNTDLSYFNKIVPCGLDSMGVTSLQQELGKHVDMKEYKQIFIASFQNVFGCSKPETLNSKPA